MSEKLTEKMPDATEETTVNENTVTAVESQEPKNVQELTNYIQSMLQQMQDRFQTMSDQVKICFLGFINLGFFWFLMKFLYQNNYYECLDTKINCEIRRINLIFSFLNFTRNSKLLVGGFHENRKTNPSFSRF